MKPTDSNNYMGIEIECYSLKDRNEVKKILKNNLSIPFDVGTDGSINEPKCPTCKLMDNCIYCRDDILNGCVLHSGFNNHKCIKYHSMEIRLLLKETEITKTINELKKAFNEFKPEVNSSCGLHIHLDARNRHPEMIFENLMSCQSLIFKIVDKKRINNAFCKKNKGNFSHEILHGDKYKHFNVRSFSEHQTIEVRIHEATVDLDLMEGWLYMLRSISSMKQRTNKTVKSISEFKRTFRPKTKKVVHYLNKKMKMYNRKVS